MWDFPVGVRSGADHSCALWLFNGCQVFSFFFFYLITGFRQPINLPVTSSLQSSNAQATSLDWKVTHCFRLVDSYYCLQGLASSTCSVWQLWHEAASLYPGGPVVLLLCLIYNFPSVGLTKSLDYYFFPVIFFFLSSFLLLKKYAPCFHFIPMKNS